LAEITDPPLIVVEEPHADFVRPLTRANISDTLAKVPFEFTEGLDAVILLSGSTKLAKVSRRQFCYGTYLDGRVFLAPFPKSLLLRTYKRPPKPSILLEYKRAGAEVRETAQGLVVEFSVDALTRFYCRDVLLHEVGHHVDRHFKKTERKHEGFADWFATEHGYRLPQDI
jgi:hypothetical protein